MNTWVKLIDTKPTENGLYKVLRYEDHPILKWRTLYCYWNSHNFVEYLSDSNHVITNIAYWLEQETPNAPLEEANKLLQTVWICGVNDALDLYIKKNNITVHSYQGNVIFIIVDDVTSDKLTYINNNFDLVRIRKVVRLK